MKHLFLPLVLLPCCALADGRVLHFSNYSLNLQNSCTTDHKLNVQIGNELYCAPLTTDWSDNSLHVSFGGTTYTVCNGECGGGEWVMPEEPEEPIVIDPSCEWTQTNSNAYLLSDGNQYFDTGVPLNSTNNIEVVAQVKGTYKGVRLFGTVGSSSCYFAMSILNNGNLGARFGYSGRTYSVTSEEATGKNTYKTENVGTNKKKYYINNRDLTSGGVMVNACNRSETMLVFNNDYPASVNWSLNEGVKLYRIRMWNSAGTLIHDFQPVAQGTNICGTVAATNAMWDFVTKKLYYPAGTGTMGYGVDQ